MKTFKRLLRITRIVLLAILAVYAAAAVVLDISDPEFKPATGPATSAEMARVLEGESQRGVCYNAQAESAGGNRLARNDFTEASLGPR